ncbi:hypothetical protein ACIQOW_03135 [Kitasatospora sp. NPDC091335]|uniref:hypothetical protein n=1 Tax=Kitasatospora sp. NPDC091335 TaxID=3364085 RepID=UPI0038088DFB
MKGIGRLHHHNVPFSLIAVVGRESIAHPDRLLDFLAALRPVSIGLNTEELEGVNTERTPPTREQAVGFWREVLDPAHHPHTDDIRAYVRAGHPLRCLRLRLDPGEGYIAPTELLPHDGSTSDLPEPSTAAFWLDHWPIGVFPSLI